MSSDTKDNDQTTNTELPEVDRRPLHKKPVTFAVDISGSTYGPTLAAEKAFIRSISNLLSPKARFGSKILPWDDKAHTILSLGQLESLEDRGGTDPGVLLSSPRHKAALKDSSLWFLMTDGLIPDESRAKFARDVAKHGIHGISCIIVVFGNPSTGPASCDISVGVGVFAAVPNCAFLFCNETNGSLRVMQTKGSFDVLLKGQPHPVLNDSSSRWDLLPQVSVADFAAILIPEPKRLAAYEVALPDSLVVNMDDLFANRLSAEEVNKIFSRVDNLDAVRMTMQARNQQDGFRNWLHQQTIRPDDPVFRPRLDPGGKAESLFTELVSLVIRGQTPPAPLQARLRAAFRENMRRFIAEAQAQFHKAEERSNVIERVSSSSFSPINNSSSMSPSMAGGTRSAPMRQRPRTEDQVDLDIYVTPRIHMDVAGGPPPPPEAPRRERHRSRGVREVASATTPCNSYRPVHSTDTWGSWETGSLDVSLRGLLYTRGFKSTKGSFKGTCPLCGASGMTMAWLFCVASSTPDPGAGPNRFPMPNGTEGFPAPGSLTRLAFPLAMGYFKETSGILASLPGAATPLSSSSRSSSSFPSLPMLVCDPCSVLYTRNGALSFGITVALPMVRFTENRDAVCSALKAAFEGRFAESDLPQVFLSVLLQAFSKATETPAFLGSPAPSDMDLDIQATMANAAAANTFRGAVEWTVHDLLYSVVALRELTESFSLPSESPAPVWPLATVLAGSFEELDSNSDSTSRGMVVPLLRYPLPGFVTILKAAPMLSVDVEIRRRVAFRRLLYLICEELDRAAEQAPHSQSISQLFAGLLGRPLSTGPNAIGAQEMVEWEPCVTVSIQALRFNSLLSAANYQMISRAAEFRYLEDPSCTWSGPALALFLHALFWLVTTQPAMNASARFQTVSAMELVGNALLRPEEVDSDDVSSILSQMDKA